jgi:hypothetical protein
MSFRRFIIVASSVLFLLIFSCRNKNSVRISGKRLSQFDRTELLFPYKETGLKGIEIRFNDSTPFIDIPVRLFNFPHDWSDFMYVRIDIYNPEDERITFFSGIRGTQNMFGDTIILEPHVKFLQQMGLNELPLTNNISDEMVPIAIRLSVKGGKKNQSLVITGIKLVNDMVSAHNPVVDKFGQRIHATWNGKVLNINDLKRDKESEHRFLESIADTIERGRFGGISGDALYQKKGFFYTIQNNDTWVLITPGGNAFWSYGVTGLMPDDFVTHGTLIKGREHLFKEKNFISNGSDVTISASGLVNFYLSNILLKYGSTDSWVDFQQKRLKKWGLNTIYAVNGDSLIHKLKTPYIKTFKTNDQQNQQIGNGLCDFFDPVWENHADSILSQCGQYTADSFLIGYIVDNDICWQHMELLTILRDSSDARLEWEKMLKIKYAWSLRNLNAVWQTDYKFWSEARDLKILSDPKMRLDYMEFEPLFVEKYFRTISGILNRYDDRHIYFGCLLPDAEIADYFVKLTGRYCDILAVLAEGEKINTNRLRSIYNRSGKPVLIVKKNIPLLSPGYLIPLDRGLSPGESADILLTNTRSAVELSFCIGLTTIQFVDQPLTGTYFTNKNQAIGFTDITDQP